MKNQKRKRVEAAKQLRNLAARIKDQRTLDFCLLAEKDTMKRQAMYERIRPHLCFTSHFPTNLAVPRIISRP